MIHQEARVHEKENGTLVFIKEKKESINKRTKKSMRKEVIYVEPNLPSYMKNSDQIENLGSEDNENKNEEESHQDQNGFGNEPEDELSITLQRLDNGHYELVEEEAPNAFETEQMEIPVSRGKDGAAVASSILKLSSGDPRMSDLRAKIVIKKNPFGFNCSSNSPK